MKIKKLYVFLLPVLVGALLLYGCFFAQLTDYSTGIMATLKAVSSNGAKTLQAATADTREVETDGNWIVWKGRSINLSYYNGITVRPLDTGLSGSVTPWAFNYCSSSPIAFDGETIAFVGRDVASCEKPKFYYMSPNGKAAGIELPFGDSSSSLQNYKVYVSGDFAIVFDLASIKNSVDFSETTTDFIDLSETTVYRADLSRFTPVFENITLSVGADPYHESLSRVYLGAVNEGAVEVYDMSAGTVAAQVLTGDDDPSTGPSDFSSANGIFTWVEDGNAYFFEPGVSSDSIEIFESGNYQDDPVAGPDYFIWYENGSNQYLAKSDVGDAQTDPTAIAYDGEIDSIETGNGFFAYIGDDDNGTDQIFVYNLTNLTAVNGVQVSNNRETAYEEIELKVDGTKVYDAFAYESVHNPSKVLVMYDFATKRLKELTGDCDFQQVPVYAVAGGKAVFIQRDHSFRLFVKRAVFKAKPVTVTPPEMFVHKFSVTNGVLTFTALERSRYLDNMLLLDDYEADDLIEVYCIDLDGRPLLKRITNNTNNESNPQTDGEFVTWSDNGGDYYAWAYDISSRKKQSIGPASSVKVAVDSGIGVWRDGSDLYYYDLNDSEDGVLVGASPDKCPNISNGLIVWENDNHPYYYDLNALTPEEIDIYDTVPTDYTYTIGSPVRTDGRFLTWLENRTNWDHDNDNDNDTAEISANVVVVHDITEGTTFDVPSDDFSYAFNGTSSRQSSVCYPSISDGIVVFAALEYGVENPDNNKEVFCCDLTAGTLELVQLTNDPKDNPGTGSVNEAAGLWDSRPRGFNGLAVWRTGGSSQWDWRGKVVAASFIDN